MCDGIQNFVIAYNAEVQMFLGNPNAAFLLWRSAEMELAKTYPNFRAIGKAHLQPKCKPWCPLAPYVRVPCVG